MNNKHNYVFGIKHDELRIVDFFRYPRVVLRDFSNKALWLSQFKNFETGSTYLIL